MYSLEKKSDLTLKEAAKILNITYLGLYVLAKNGKVPAYRLGSKWRISHTEFEKFGRGEYKIDLTKLSPNL